MSSLCNIVKCKNCQDKYAESSVDKNNPYFDDDSDFCVVIEWLNKEEAIKKIQDTKCPKCGSDDWYFTDTTEH